MQIVEEIEEKANKEWEAEKDRAIKAKEEKLPFGYDYILESLDGIACTMRPDTLFQGGVLLGRLIQVIIENKEEE